MAVEAFEVESIVLKLMVIGDGGVGKSCFITRFVFQKKLHQVVVDGITINLEIVSYRHVTTVEPR
jgi:GTPase SAR1 family protein